MPIVHLQGKVLPYDPTAYHVLLKDLPPATFYDDYTKQSMTISVKITESIIDVEFDLPNFDENDWSSLLMRAWDLSRAAVDLYCFKVGWGLSVMLDTLVKPDGTKATFMPKMEHLSAHSTALDSLDPTVNNYDACYRLLLSEPPLFMAMNDLIVSITLPHHAVINCARAVEGLRVLMTSVTMDRKQAWPIFQTNLNIDRSFREYVTDVSTGPRHGDRAHITGAVVQEAVKRAWIIMNRFLEYRKRGNQALPITEFPLLTN